MTKLASEIISKSTIKFILEPSPFLNMIKRKPLTRRQKFMRRMRYTFTETVSDDYSSTRFLKIWRFYFLIGKS